jgi:hypothetical protein
VGGGVRGKVLAAKKLQQAFKRVTARTLELLPSSSSVLAGEPRLERKIRSRILAKVGNHFCPQK